MSHKLIHLMAMLSLSIHHSAAQTEDTPANSRPFIEVTGKAEMKVVPDEIFIAVKLRERGSGAGKLTVEAQEEQLKKVVVALGIDPALLTLTDVIADLERNWFKKDDVVATKRFMLKVGDAEMVRKVFVELDRMQVNDARIHHVSHSLTKNYRRELRTLATEDALQNAKAMLKGVGQQVGAPIMLQELSDEDLRSARRSRGNSDPRLYGFEMSSFEVRARKQTIDGDLEDLGVSFSLITIYAVVYVQFAIVPQ